MIITRRDWLIGAAGATLAACARHKLFAGRPTRRLDTLALDRGFPALADRARPGVFAMGVMDLGASQTWYWNTDRRFPLQDVQALPLAAAALAEIAAGRLAPAERLEFSSLELSPPFSLINQRWPTPPDRYAAVVPVSTLFTLALLWSDNTAADLLMKRIGGPGMVGAWLQARNLNGLQVDRYERELLVEMAGMPSFRPAWKDPAPFLAARDAVPAAERHAAMNAYLADPRDTTTLPGALDFIGRLALGELLPPGATGQLLGWMEAAPGGERRLRAGLPAAVRLAHRAGTSPTDLGLTPVVNDLGVAAWPDGRRFAIAAFLTGSTAPEPERDALFAQAARLITTAAG